MKLDFRGVSQTLHATDMTAMQGQSDLLFISKPICAICAHLVANFLHHITIQTQVAVVLHVYLATRDKEN